MCIHSLESQPYPGLHQKQCGQQVEGGDSAPLLHSGETSPGVLHPALEPSAQKRHGAVGAGPGQGHQSDQNTSAVSTGLESWGCSTWGREGSRETLLRPLST